MNTEKTILDLGVAKKKSERRRREYVSIRRPGGATDLEYRHFVREIKLGVSARDWCCGRDFTLACVWALRLSRVVLATASAFGRSDA